MKEIKYTDEFITWLEGLKDATERVRLKRRIDKYGRGIKGDVEPVGEGVSEMREHFGAGYRMYFIERGGALVVMLGGGTKSKQQKDIEKAKRLARRIKG
ncbi:MAG: addiction module killer protein [Gammaproteobacteria bacterium]|nr:MAG: addiction module killer protein [Gammaproteobacteria bacterium]